VRAEYREGVTVSALAQALDIVVFEHAVRSGPGQGR
jgi:lysozyme family protein